jgi:transcriptional regulator with XRE-family HTH domain
MKTSVYSIHYDKVRAWLKNAREAQNLSLRDVGSLSGRDHSIIGKIEQARRKIEIIEFIEYCQILGIDPHEGMDILIDSLKVNSR